MRSKMFYRGNAALKSIVGPTLICSTLAVYGCGHPSKKGGLDVSAILQRGVTAVALSAESQEVAAGTGDGSVYVWSVSTGELRAELPALDAPVEYVVLAAGTKAARRCPIRGRPVAWVAFAPGTNDILAGSGADVRVLERETGTVRPIRMALRLDERPGISAVSDDQHYVGSAAGKHAILWNPRTGERLKAFGPLAAPVALVSVSPSNRYILGASCTDVRVWDTSSCEPVCTLDAESTGQVRCAAWLPDERRFVTVSAEARLKIWDALNGEELLSQDITGFRGQLPVHDLRICATSRDGRFILLVGPKAILLDADTAKELRRLGDDQDAFNVACFSADGRHVLTGEFAKVRLWETKTGQELRQFIVPALE